MIIHKFVLHTRKKLCGEQYRNIISVYLKSHKFKSYGHIFSELIDTIEHEVLHYCLNWTGVCRNNEKEIEFIQKRLKKHGYRDSFKYL